MPTYVYRFLDSDETIEVHQSFSDPALTEAVHPATGEVQPAITVAALESTTKKSVGHPAGTSAKNGFSISPTTRPMV